MVDGDFDSVAGADGVGVAGCRLDSFLLGGVGGEGEGVRGGGGWPSEDSHASFAAFSTELAKGSNSLRTSLGTGAGTTGEPVAWLELENIDWPYDSVSGKVKGLTSAFTGTFSESADLSSFHGFGEAGKSGSTAGASTPELSATGVLDWAPTPDVDGGILGSTVSWVSCASDGLEPIYVKAD